MSTCFDKLIGTVLVEMLTSPDCCDADGNRSDCGGLRLHIGICLVLGSPGLAGTQRNPGPGGPRQWDGHLGLRQLPVHLHRGAGLPLNDVLYEVWNFFGAPPRWNRTHIQPL